MCQVQGAKALGGWVRLPSLAPDRPPPPSPPPFFFPDYRVLMSWNGGGWLENGGGQEGDKSGPRVRA